MGAGKDGIDAMTLEIGKWKLVAGALLLAGSAIADPWYNTNTIAWSFNEPAVGVWGGKAYPGNYRNREILTAQGWVELTGGRGAWVIDGASVRLKTEAELQAESGQRAAERAEQNRQQERMNDAQSAVGYYEPIEVIAALAKIQNARINAIIDRIIQINPASSNSLSRARLTNAELKQAIREELGD
jgi:hypothetical protein